MGLVIKGSTPKQQIDSYRKLMTKLGQSVQRGVNFSLNGVAQDARDRIVKVLPKVFDQPVPYTLHGIGARSVPLKSEGGSSAVYVLGDQSAYMKFSLGDEPSVRQPGDVGPADKYIYIPNWPNLKKIGIKPVGGAGLPRQTLERFGRESGVTLSGSRTARVVAKRRRGSKGANGGVFFGKPVYGGKTHVLGFYARPVRKRVGGRLINQGRPMLLVRATDKAAYNPILQKAWDEAATEAMAMLPVRLQREYVEKLEHLGRFDFVRKGNLDQIDDFLKVR